MNSTRGILLRVGIDQTFGTWNAPVDPDTWEFVYLPIPEDLASFHPDLEVTYDTFSDDLKSFARGRQLEKPLTLPAWLAGRGCHLDPDFSQLTYGDQPHGRAQRSRPSSLVTSLLFLPASSQFEDVNKIYCTR